jgi:hypothetical protein
LLDDEGVIEQAPHRREPTVGLDGELPDRIGLSAQPLVPLLALVVGMCEQLVEA